MIGIGGGAKYAVLKAKSRNKEADNMFELFNKKWNFNRSYFLLAGIFQDGISHMLGTDNVTFNMTSAVS